MNDDYDLEEIHAQMSIQLESATVTNVKHENTILELRAQLTAANARADKAEGERAQWVRDFASAALHGDGDHREWLTKAGECFIEGLPLPEPNGKGRAEAAESQRDALTAELAAAKADGERLEKFVRSLVQHGTTIDITDEAKLYGIYHEAQTICDAIDAARTIAGKEGK